MNIGVVIVTHYELGEQMLQALRSIIPNAPEFYAVSVSPDQSVDEMRKAISDKLAKAERRPGRVDPDRHVRRDAVQYRVVVPG